MSEFKEKTQEELAKDLAKEQKKQLTKAKKEKVKNDEHIENTKKLKQIKAEQAKKAEESVEQSEQVPAIKATDIPEAHKQIIKHHVDHGAIRDSNDRIIGRVFDPVVKDESLIGQNIDKNSNTTPNPSYIHRIFP